MDDLLPSLPAMAPPAALVGIAVWWLVVVMRQAASDRSGYQQVLADVRDQHQAVLAARDSEIDRLRYELAARDDELESERRKRWAAEDAAAKYRRRLNGCDGRAVSGDG